MDTTTQEQVGSATNYTATSVEDLVKMADAKVKLADAEVKLASIARDDRKTQHTIDCDRHNMQNARLQWLHRALETGNLGSTFFAGPQREALLNRYGKLLLQFTRLSEDDQVVWPS